MTTAGDDMRKRVDRAVAWVGLASGIVAVFDAITLALLMWLWVAQADLGIATLAATLFYFIDLTTEAGLSSVLIQREKLDDDTISSVFWLNAGVSVVAFGIVLGVGPLVGKLQGHAIIGWMLIGYGTKLLYQNLYFVPAALLRREMRFKELSIVRTVANAGDVVAKVSFAALGEPIWCFVAGPLARVAITGIGLQICRPWRPRWVLHTHEARAMLKFGFKTTGSQYLQHFYNNIHYQVANFYFGEAAVGAYRVAYEMVLYPVNWVSNVVAQVAFPAFARLRSDRSALAAQFLRFSRQNLATVLPLLVLVTVAAEEVLALLFPNVQGAATAARLLCIVGLLRAVDCLYLPLLDGVGLAGRNLLVAALAAVVLFGCDVIFSAALGPHLDLLAVVVGRIIGYPIVIGVHAYLALGQLELTARHYAVQLGRLAVWAALASVVATAIGLALPAGLETWVRLAIVGGAGLVTLVSLLQLIEGLGLKTIVKSVK